MKTRSYILLFLIALLSSSEIFGQLSLSLPLPRSVFQRDKTGKATVYFYYQVLPGGPTSYSAKSRLIALDKFGNQGTPTAWVNRFTGPTDMTHNFSQVILTGWYLMEIGIFAGSNPTPTLTASVKFGVGDVIFIAGQSNAQGTDGITNSAVNNIFYDCVNSISANEICKYTYKFPIISKIQDGSIISPTGNRSAWAYNKLAKRVSDELAPPKVVPTLFFNGAFTGSSVSNWVTTAQNVNATASLPLLNGVTCCQTNFADWESEGAAGQPYLGLKNALDYFGSMFGAKVVLWHQGESDNHINTTSTNYRDSLRTLIIKSREHFNTNLSWAISRASKYQGVDDPNVTAGQEATYNIMTHFKHRGAWNSDVLSGPNRFPDNTHFNEQGLKALGDQYYESYNSGSGGAAIKGANPVLAKAPASASVSATTSTTVTLTVSGGSGYQYRWVINNGNIKTPFATTRSITVNKSLDRQYRCYVIDPSFNIVLSQAIHTPLRTLPNLRAAAKEDTMETEAFEVFPNPANEKITISYNIKNSGLARIELLSLQGRAVKSAEIVSYGAGKRTYTFGSASLPSGIYICRLQVGNVFYSKKVLISH